MMSVHLGNIKLQWRDDGIKQATGGNMLRFPGKIPPGLVFRWDMVKGVIMLYSNIHSHDIVSLLYDKYSSFIDATQTLVKI